MGYPQRTAEEAVQIKCCNFITKWLQAAPPAHTMAKDDGVILPYCTGGVCMSVCFHRLAAPGQLVLFAMGGTAYLALEIAWRGTTHWTMFLAGGACLCALDALGRLPLPTPLLAGIGAVGVSVLEPGLPAAVCCMLRCGITARNGATLPGLCAQNTRHSGSFCACGCWV